MNLSRRLSTAVLITALNLLLCLPILAQEQPPTDTTQIPTQMQFVSADSETQTTGHAPPAGPASDDSGWHFNLSPYLWFAGAHGTVGARGHNTSIHESPGDLLSHLNIGLMGALEARHKRFLLNGDLIWIRLSDSKALPFPGLGAISADVRVGQFIWTSKGGFRVIDHPRFKADATVGVRYWHLGQKLSFNPSLLGIDFNGSQSWADILVGGHINFPVGKKTEIDALGDVGGWNATAKLDYQFAAILGYKICSKWTLRLGYRYMFVDYRPSNLAVYSMVTSGALLGVTYTFK